MTTKHAGSLIYVLTEGALSARQQGHHRTAEDWRITVISMAFPI